eukprot:GHVL01037830.1.p1 GENE.GHVL01037830.1~~GHVL01037830.1.p1  ORF type:complete len:808 (+),score=110.73 GHVL01037830.1:88-2511(+)
MALASFMAMLRIVAFICALWTGSTLSKMVGISPIVAEILTGMIFGPHVLKLLPEPYAICESKIINEFRRDSEDELSYALCEEQTVLKNSWLYELQTCPNSSCAFEECELHNHHDCSGVPSIFALIGSAGVALMIFESGMHFDFRKVAQVGASAFLVAVMGTILPIIFGMLFVGILSNDFGAVYSETDKSGLSVGISLAPTSVGIALALLVETKQLGSDYGQAIITAAFADDVLSLLAYIILEQLKLGSPSFETVGLPAVYSIVFLFVGSFLAIFFWPPILSSLFRNIKENPSASFQPRDQVQLGLMFLLLIFYAYISSLIGSHLLGCFVAGMTFAAIHRSHHIWTSQTKRISQWMVRLFFGATVAFAIPVHTLFSLDSFWKGLVIALVPCILAKVISGIHMGSPRWVIGWAMVGRAEFAYFIAENAVQSGLMRTDVFAWVIWALLICTIIAPFGFKFFLLREQRKNLPTKSIKIVARRSKWNVAHDSEFKVQISVAHRSAVVLEITESFHHVGLDIVEMSMTTDGFVDIGIYKVRPRAEGVVDDDKLLEIQKTLVEILDNHDAHVLFLPSSVDTSLLYPLMKICIFASHNPDLMTNLISSLMAENVMIVEGNIELHGGENYVATLLCKLVANDNAESVSISEEFVIRIRGILEDICVELAVAGEVLVTPLDPEQAGPTGDIAHDPFNLKIDIDALKKIRVNFRKSVKNPALLAQTVSLVKSRGLRIVAGRFSVTNWIIYLQTSKSKEEGFNVSGMQKLGTIADLSEGRISDQSLSIAVNSLLQDLNIEATVVAETVRNESKYLSFAI